MVSELFGASMALKDAVVSGFITELEESSASIFFFS